jgi:hypothetical protein
MAEMQIATVQYVSPVELDTKLAEANERLVAALEALVTQQMLTAALAPLAAKSDVAAAIAQAVVEAVRGLATKTEVEAAKAAAIREATAGRPNWTETNKRVNDLLVPILARLAALEAR